MKLVPSFFHFIIFLVSAPRFDAAGPDTGKSMPTASYSNSKVRKKRILLQKKKCPRQ